MWPAWCWRWGGDLAPPFEAAGADEGGGNCKDSVTEGWGERPADQSWLVVERRGTENIDSMDSTDCTSAPPSSSPPCRVGAENEEGVSGKEPLLAESASASAGDSPRHIGSCGRVGACVEQPSGNTLLPAADSDPAESSCERALDVPDRPTDKAATLPPPLVLRPPSAAAVSAGAVPGSGLG